MQVFQIQLKTGYSMTDLRTDLASLYMKSGLKGIGITFLMTDSHVSDERFLVLINDMLAFGEVSELFADEDIDNIVNSVRNEVIFNVVSRSIHNSIRALKYTGRCKNH